MSHTRTSQPRTFALLTPVPPRLCPTSRPHTPFTTPPQLAPFAKYAPCLSNDMYATAVNNYLGGATTIDEARKACLS